MTTIRTNPTKNQGSMVKMNEQEQEITRLCRIIGEDKTTIAKLEEQRLRLEEVIEKQNDLIETLWELYTDDRITKH